MNFRLGSIKEMAQRNGSIRSGESSQNQILNNQQSLRSSLRTPQGMLQRPHNYLRPNNLNQGNNNNVGARATLPPRVPLATSSSNNSSALMAAARYGRPLPLPLPTPSVPISRMGNSLNNTPLSLNPPTQNSSSSSSTGVGVGVGVGGNLHGYANGFPNPSRRPTFHNPNLNLPYRGENSNRVNNSSVVNHFNNSNPIPRVDHMNNNNFPRGVNAFPAQLPPIQIKDLDLLSSNSGGVNRERGMKMKQPMCEFEETELTLGSASKKPRMSSAPPGYNYHNYFQNLLQSDEKEELDLFRDEKKNEFSFSEITTDAKGEDDDHEEDLDLSLHL